MAIIFTVSLLALWMLAGFGLFAAVRFRSDFYLRLLFAPAVGIASNVIVLFTLSRLGYPIKTVAMPILLGMLLLAGYFLLTQRRVWRRRAFVGCFLLILATIIPFAEPFIKYGVEWLAFVNGDMSYYSLSSTRFLNYGYSELPPSGNIYDESDHSLAYWFFPNVIGHRSGADLLLAQIVGVSGLTAHQVYMPLTIACHACVAAGAGALALIGTRKWFSASWAIILVVLSPMLAQEVTRQLLAQTLGLAFLAGLCVAYVKAMEVGRPGIWAGVSVLLGSALAIVYSEVMPFFLLFVIVSEIARWRKWISDKVRSQYLRVMVVMSVGGLLLLNSYLVDVVRFIMLSMGGSFQSSVMSMQGNGLSLFPHFFLPSGGALLWGWLPFGTQANQAAIIAGILATFLFVVSVLVAVPRNLPSVRMSLVMMAVAASMYIGGNGFGLFKIAMFIQPFMLATCVILATLWVTHTLLRQIGLGLLGLSFVPALLDNVEKVSGEIGQSRVPYASTGQLGRQLKELSGVARQMGADGVYSDTPSREFFLLQSYYFKDIFFRATSLPSLRRPVAEKFAGSTGGRDKLRNVDEVVVDRGFDFGAGRSFKFKATELPGKEKALLLNASGAFSPINRLSQPANRRLYLQPIHEKNNHLVYKQTSLGTSYVSRVSRLDHGDVGLWGVEPDPMIPGETISGIGRYHLYEVLNPIPDSRMLLSVTASMNKGDDFRLPPAIIYGGGEVRMPLVGRGSARVIGPGIGPRHIEGGSYIGVDFGREGSFLERKRSGVMELYGSDVKLDIRKIVGFARDISYVSPAWYDNLRRPFAVRGFPDALRNPALEYSGIFEDGWVSEAAYVVLGVPGSSRALQLSGMIPDVDGNTFSTSLRVLVDGRLAYQGQHTKGSFNISIPVAGIVGGKQSIRVLVESSNLQRLPNGDDRPVSLLINEIGFVDTPMPGAKR